MDFSEGEKSAVWNIIASVLHIGNIDFDESSLDPNKSIFIINLQNFKMF